MKHKLLVHSLRIPQVLYKKVPSFKSNFPYKHKIFLPTIALKEGSVKGGFRSRQIYE